MKNNNYMTIQGWMVNELNLKGNELLVYALIYGFSQDGECKFAGSLNYISEWISASKQTVINVLKSLEEKNLIIKEQKVINNIIFNEYRVVKNFDHQSNNLNEGSQKILPGVVKKFDPIINNNIREKFTAPTFEEVKEYFASRNLDSVWAKKFYDYYSAGNWIDGKGQKIKNWKQKVIAVWDKPEYKIVPPEVEAKREENAIKNNYWFENSSKVNNLRTGELLMVNILYILRDKADKGDLFAKKIIDTMRTSELTDEQLEKIKNYIISVNNK